jgi:uncharacterized protein YjbJ (UPF0337 family)
MGIQDKITGRIKQAAGDLAGDSELRSKGIAEERKGEAKEELDKARAEADAKANEVANLERATAKSRARSRP